MTRTKFWCLILVSLGLLFVGSFFAIHRWRDPNARKQRYYKSAMSYVARGKYSEAEIELQNAIAMDPNYTIAHYQLAQCYLQEQIWSGVFLELSRVVSLTPQDWKAQLELGNMLLAAHQYAQAAGRAKLVLQAQPKDVDAQTLLAKALAAGGDAQKALDEMQKVIALAPKESNTYVSLATVYLAASREPEAEESYKRAISLDPSATEPIAALAALHARELRFAEAEQEFNQAIKLDPKNLSIRRALADVALAEGKEDAAAAVLSHAKKDFPDSPAASQMLGDFYVQTEQTDKAYDEFSAFYHAHPTNGLARTGYIRALVATKRLDEATKLNDDVLRESPDSVPALIAEGQIWLQQGRVEDAIRVLKLAVAAEPKNAFAPYLLGMAHAQAGQREMATEELTRAVTLRPNLIPAQKALARLALEENQLELAKASAGAIIASRPASQDGYYLRAVAEARGKNYDSAETDLKKCMQMTPQDPLPYVRLGDIRVAQRRESDAEDFYNRALQLAPALTEALNGILITYDREKKPAATAIARIQEQITRSPNSVLYYQMLGQAFYQEKDLEDAESALEKAVAIDGRNVNSLVMLASMQASKGSIAQAQASAQRAIQQNPQDMHGYAVLAEIQKEAGNWQDAEKNYQKALQINPQFGMGANNLAKMLLEHGGNIDTALSLAQTARRLIPTSPKTADTLAWAEISKGGLRNNNSAVEILQSVIAQTPDDPTTRYHLGLAYEQLKMPALANEQFHRVLRLDPEFSKRDEIKGYLASAK